MPSPTLTKSNTHTPAPSQPQPPSLTHRTTLHCCHTPVQSDHPDSFDYPEHLRPCRRRFISTSGITKRWPPPGIASALGLTQPASATSASFRLACVSAEPPGDHCRYHSHPSSCPTPEFLLADAEVTPVLRLRRRSSPRKISSFGRRRQSVLDARQLSPRHLMPPLYST